MESFRNYINRINIFLGKVETGMLCMIVVMMIGLAVLEIILRYVFKTSLLWKTVMLENLTLWLCFLGATLASCERRHISIDVLNRILPPNIQRFRGYIIDVLSLIVITILSYLSLIYLDNEMKGQGRLIGPVPLWYAKTIIPIGFILMGIHLLLQIIINLTDSHDNHEEVKGESE